MYRNRTKAWGFLMSLSAGSHDFGQPADGYVRASHESRHFTSCTHDLGPLRVVCTRVPLFPQSTYVTVTEGKLQYLSMPLTLLMYLDHT